MNLITDSWIPVMRLDGATPLVGLDGLFAEAGEIRDLAVKPHERIAVMRLLICITQAALDGPKDQDAWEDCRVDIPRRAREYLTKWKAAFELFGDGARFLQVPNLKSAKKDAEDTAATKLDVALSTGHNATVFDNAAGSERPQSGYRLALTLLTFQCLSPCGILGAVSWSNQTIPKCTGKHAPAAAASMLHAFLVGQSLLETIHLNLLDRQSAVDYFGPGGWGKPVWEAAPGSPNSKPEIHNATLTYLGRLLPVSRLVRLHDDQSSITLGDGLEYPLYPTFREPSNTLVTREEKPIVLGATLERHLWRNLPALVVKRRADKSLLSGPLALQNLADSSGATLWLGAVVTNKNKIEDIVEAAYTIPPGMFKDLGRQAFEAGIEYADNWERALYFTTRTYAQTLKLQPAPTDKARQHFWTTIEQYVPLLLALTDAPVPNTDFRATPWGQAVRIAAEAAYDFACPRQNPRQIEAFAKGRQQLFYRKPQPKPDGQPSAAVSKKGKQPNS